MRCWKIFLLLSVFCISSGVGNAVTEVTVDWESGEVEVRKEEPPEAQEVPQEPGDSTAVCEKHNQRLRSIIRTQQGIILKQQQKLQEQQRIIRHQDNVIRGLDLLRRQGK